MKIYILCRFLSFDITLISFGNLSFLIKIKFTQIRQRNCILITCHYYKKNKFLKQEISILFQLDVLPIVRYLFIFLLLLVFFYICLYSNQILPYFNSHICVYGHKLESSFTFNLPVGLNINNHNSTVQSDMKLVL